MGYDGIGVGNLVFLELLFIKIMCEICEISYYILWLNIMFDFI